MQQKTRRRQETDNSPMSLDESVVTQSTESSQGDENLVARRAYQRYEERGREDGHDQDDWFAAERELTGEGTSEGDTRGE
jgi:hypothetical protein